MVAKWEELETALTIRPTCKLHQIKFSIIFKTSNIIWTLKLPTWLSFLDGVVLPIELLAELTKSSHIPCFLSAHVPLVLSFSPTTPSESSAPTSKSSWLFVLIGVSVIELTSSENYKYPPRRYTRSNDYPQQALPNNLLKASKYYPKELVCFNSISSNIIIPISKYAPWIIEKLFPVQNSLLCNAKWLPFMNILEN